MMDYSRFRVSLRRLEEQHQNHHRGDPRWPRVVREAVAESVIQRFETCYDCLWKLLKRHLVDRLGIPDVPNSPKPVLRLANENYLLSAPVQRWLRYADARIATSHDYDGAKARACLELVADFLDDAIRLYQTLSGESWE